MSPTNLSSPNKEPEYLTQNSNPDISESLDPQAQYNTNSIYSHNKGSYDKNDYSKGDLRNQFVNDGRLDYMKGASHKRHTSMLHGHFNHSKGNMNDQSPHRDISREGLYSTAPDLPPRVDRAVKPMGLLTTTPNKTNG